ncbi:MAG: phosphopentomutase [Firmicutes bacterium]|nr:phosphopentomutase [Bacillota bacterium]
MDKRRAILIVLDSLGVGELPDADRFGDQGADTFGHISDKLGDDFRIPNLKKLGIGNIDALGVKNFPELKPIGAYGKLGEQSIGKDTITGHWEIAGIETMTPFKTYPDGFPEEFIKAFEEKIGTEVIGNYPESGTVIIDRHGEEHEKTGKPIVYTSSDSVFQIAANTAVIPLERLYEMCQIARDLLQGDWACGRVIARPYIIHEQGKRERTSDRHDYAVSPPEETLLNKVEKAGMTSYAVGKINDIFNGYGVTEYVKTKDNMDGVDKTLEAMDKVEEGFIFTNLVDFDSKYGHRRDAEGYGKAIMEFDARLPEIYLKMKENDILILCADHGNDPTAAGFDHTREYIPVIVAGAKIKKGANIGTRTSFADIGATIAEYLGTEELSIGKSFLSEIME